MDKISVKCTCENCDNKLAVSVSDSDAQLLIYEIDEHHGRRMSVIIPRDIGMAIIALLRGWQKLVLRDGA